MTVVEKRRCAPIARSPWWYRPYAVTLWYVLIGVAAVGQVPINADEELEAVTIKQRVLSKIDAALQELSNALAEIDASHEPKAAIWGEVYKEERAALKRLRGLIRRTKPEEVSQVLVDQYVQDSRRIALDVGYLKLSELVVSLGSAALEPLGARYPDAPPLAKEGILRVVGAIGEREGLAIVERGLIDSENRVRIAALNALVAIQGSEARERLHALLKEETSPVVNEAILDGLRRIQDPEWQDAAVTLMEQGRLELSYLTRLSSPEEYHEDAVGTHLPFLLGVIRGDDLTGKYHAASLVSRVNRRVYLKALLPLVPTILHGRFHHGETMGIVGFTQSASPATGWLLHDLHQLLEAIPRTLTAEDLADWLQHVPDDMLTRLYLEELLAQKGGVVPATSPEAFRFQIEVLDETGELLEASSHVLRFEQDMVLEGMPRVNGFPVHRYTVRLHLDKDAWTFRLDPFLIDLKPHSVGFTATVPIGGAYEIKLRQSCPLHNQMETLVWRIRHLERPETSPTSSAVSGNNANVDTAMVAVS